MSDKVFLYFDPMHLLPEEGRKRWANDYEHEAMIREALCAADALKLERAVG